MISGTGRDPLDECAAAATALPRPRQATVRKLRHIAGNVWGVGDDQVEAAAADRVKQVASDRLDTDAVERSVQADRTHSAARDIDSCDPRGPFERSRQPQHPAPSAQVEDIGIA